MDMRLVLRRKLVSDSMLLLLSPSFAPLSKSTATAAPSNPNKKIDGGNSGRATGFIHSDTTPFGTRDSVA